MEGDLRREFGPAVDDRAVMQSCLDICSAFNLSAEDLRYKWEAMTFGSANPATQVLDADNSNALRAHIKRELETRVELATKKSSIKTRGMRTGKLFGNSNNHLKERPTAIIKHDTTTLKDSQSPGQALTPHTTVKSSQAQLVLPQASQMKPYRYMYEKLTERSDALDTRIEKFAELVQSYYRIEDLADPSLVTEEEVTVIGRIVSDSEAKLEDSTLALESSRRLGNGARVALRFDLGVTIQPPASSIYLFPGMILAARGKNGGGGWFSVSQILSLPEPIAQNPPLDASVPFTMLIASGPFVPDSEPDLDFRSLKAFLVKTKTNPPSALLLTGPFIDHSHPSIRSGNISKDVKQIFADGVGSALRAFAQSCPSTQICLVSSVKDVINSHYVFPQAAMEADGLDLPPSATLLPNPSAFAINGVWFGVSTVDILFHLNKQGYERVIGTENNTSGETRDRLRDLCSNVMRQRNFYPLFPTPPELSQDVNLDMSHHMLLDFEHMFDGGERHPNILILPSNFKQFHRVVGETVIINPSTFAKGQTATRLTFKPNDVGRQRYSVSFEHLDV